MQTFEVVLQELPKCDPETWSEQMLLGKMVPIDLFNADLPKPLFVKNMVSVKYSKVKQDKMR